MFSFSRAFTTFVESSEYPLITRSFLPICRAGILFFTILIFFEDEAVAIELEPVSTS